MNSIRKNILMDITYLMRYKEFLLNKKAQPNNSARQSSNARASFCTLCNDDCVCMNSKHKLLIANAANSAHAANLKKMECSKYCNENIFVDCICL
jgi:hypothetical protein